MRIMPEPKVWLLSFNQIYLDVPTAQEIDRYLPGFYRWLPGFCYPDTLIELAGRNCYQSWDNPSGRSNKAYIANIIRQKHYSVLEHGWASFLIICDRATSHEIVRHRHLSFSQLSTRYVDLDKAMFLVPSEDPYVQEFLARCMEMYRWAEEEERQKLQSMPDSTQKRKMIREQARRWLPHNLATSIVVSGNYRAWFEAIEKRTSLHADQQIREVFLMILKHLQHLSPNVFEHFKIKKSEVGQYAELEVPKE